MEKKRLVLKTGQHGPDVRILQELLYVKPADGIFGNATREAVIKYQRTNNMTPDGIVGPLTWKSLNHNPEETFADTDELTSATWIERYHLPEGEYVKVETSKKYIFLHHTAGRHNPFKTIDGWARDSRGRVGTNYCIGGVPSYVDIDNASQKDLEMNGRVVQAIDDKYSGYHLGPTGSSYMTKHSLSIEINSAGYLTKKGDKFYTWYNEEVHKSQVCELSQPFRGHKYYHKYTKAQLEALEALIYHLKEKHDISICDGMPKMSNEERYEFSEKAWRGAITGILSHANVRKDKSDVFPQPELSILLDSFKL